MNLISALASSTSSSSYRARKTSRARRVSEPHVRLGVLVETSTAIEATRAPQQQPRVLLGRYRPGNRGRNDEPFSRMFPAVAVATDTHHIEPPLGLIQPFPLSRNLLQRRHPYVQTVFRNRQTALRAGGRPLVLLDGTVNHPLLHERGGGRRVRCIKIDGVPIAVGRRDGPVKVTPGPNACGRGRGRCHPRPGRRGRQRRRMLRGPTAQGRPI